MPRSSSLVASFCSLLASLSLSACGPAAEAPTEDGESSLTAPEGGLIEGVDHIGEGCAGSATTSVSPDGQASTTTFGDLLAATGPGIDEAQAKRSCLMQVRVRVPAGYQYTFESVDVRGFVALDIGVSGERTSRYVIPGDDLVPNVGNQWGSFGIEGQNWQMDDVGERSKLGWSRCGRAGSRAWIGTEVSVDDSDLPGATGQVAIDTIDVELRWRRCR